MAELDIGQASTTDMKGTVSEVSVPPQHLDSPGDHEGETWHDIEDADEKLGFYKSIPELKSSLKVLAQRVCGQGWTAPTPMKVRLDSIRGWGEDSFQSIMQNMLIQKKVFGDAFSEIVRNEQGTPINIKPLYPGDMRIVVNPQGLIERYEQRTGQKGGKIKKFRPDQILHMVNDRIGNEIHGGSVIDPLKFIIEAKNEALRDERKIRHRELAMGTLYVDTDDPDKIAQIQKKFQKAVNNTEVLVLPKDVAEIQDNPNSPRDRVQWLQYLDNLFYQVVGTPKVLVTSEGFTEAGGKAGLLAFEPNEIAEKKELEADLWNQVAIRVTFARAPSLMENQQETETKNAGQTGIQRNETDVRPTRTE